MRRHCLTGQPALRHFKQWPKLRIATQVYSFHTPTPLSLTKNTYKKDSLRERCCCRRGRGLGIHSTSACGWAPPRRSSARSEHSVRPSRISPRS